MTVFTQLQTPIGNLLVARDGEGLRHIRFESEGSNEPEPSWTRDDGALAEPVAQLKAYFAGELREFDLLL